MKERRKETESDEDFIWVIQAKIKYDTTASWLMVICVMDMQFYLMFDSAVVCYNDVDGYSVYKLLNLIDPF